MNIVLALLIYIFTYGPISVSSVKFFFQLSSDKHKCIGEYLTANTVAIFSIVSSHQNIRARLFDPNGNAVYNKETQSNVKVAFTASEAGNHHFCIENFDPIDCTIHFEFLSGVSAKDYSAIAKKSNLKPIELNLQKLEDMIGYLIHELSSVMTHEEISLAVNDALSNKIILCSMLTLLSMIIVGIFETVYIQRYLHNRKLI